MIAERRLCFFNGTAEVSGSGEKPQETFENLQTSVKQLLEKYGDVSQEMQKKYSKNTTRTLDRIKQYREIEATLLAKLKADPTQRTAITSELQQGIAELHDSLTHNTYIRELYPHRNRFDTDEEHAEVLRLGAEHLKDIKEQRAQEQRNRKTMEGQSREAEQKWLSNEFDTEVSYLLILSQQGADYTISKSVDRLMSNLALLKIVKQDKLGEFIKGIDWQIQNNSNLTPATKEKLQSLRKELAP